MTAGVQNKIDRIERAIERMESGRRSFDYDAGQCADYISWVAKFNKVPRNVWEPLRDRLTRLFEEMPHEVLYRY